MSQTLRIIIIGYGIEPWPPHNEAIKNFINAYAPILSNRGHKILIISMSRHICFPFAFIRSQGIVYLLLRTSRLGKHFHQLLLLLLSHLWSAEVIHFWGRPTGYSHRLTHSKKIFLTIYDQGLAQDAILAQQVSPETTLIAESNWLRDRVRLSWQREAHVIYPGIDLSQFTARSRHTFPPSYHAIFASSPLPRHHGADEEHYLESRGVPETIVISHLIGQQIDFETILLWRKDPTRVRELVNHRQSVNVLDTYIYNMNEFLETFDLCFALFKDTPHVKAVPQSVIECLAKGIPAVCRQDSALGDMLGQHGASLNIPADKSALAAHTVIELLMDQPRYHRMSIAARQMAQRYFNIQTTVGQYLTLYHSPTRGED